MGLHGPIAGICFSAVWRPCHDQVHPGRCLQSLAACFWSAEQGEEPHGKVDTVLLCVYMPDIKNFSLANSGSWFPAVPSSLCYGVEKNSSSRICNSARVGGAAQIKAAGKAQAWGSPFAHRIPRQKGIAEVGSWLEARWLFVQQGCNCSLLLPHGRQGHQVEKCLQCLGRHQGTEKKNMYLLCTVVFSNVCIFIGDGMRPCRYVFHEETHLSPSFQRPLRGKLGFFWLRCPRGLSGPAVRWW